MDWKAAKECADEFIKKSVAPGTLKGYKREWVKWLNFARSRGFCLAPPSASSLEIYLMSEIAPRKSVAAIEAVSASVNWHCAEIDKPSPFSRRRIGLLVRGMKAEFRRPVVPRLPFQRAHIRRFLDMGRQLPRSRRAAVIMAMCFADFLWFSEVVNMRLEDVSVDRAGVHFKVRKAKNHRMGFDVCLPVNRKKMHCVGRYVLEFLETDLRWAPGVSGFLCCKVDALAFFPRTSVSYSALHEGCKDLIKKAGLDPSRYSTHSAKRGSATEAVSAGCSDAEVTSLGRWRSANTGRQYVHSGQEFRKKLTDRYSL
jgi:integrase